MKRISPLIIVLAGIFSTGVRADGLFLRLGDGVPIQHRAIGQRGYDPGFFHGHGYGPVTSFFPHHRLSGYNRYGLSITRSGRLSQDRRQRHRSYRPGRARHDAGHGYESGYGHGYRDGYRDAQRRNRALYYHFLQRR